MTQEKTLLIDKGEGGMPLCYKPTFFHTEQNLAQLLSSHLSGDVLNVLVTAFKPFYDSLFRVPTHTFETSPFWLTLPQEEGEIKLRSNIRTCEISSNPRTSDHAPITER